MEVLSLLQGNQVEEAFDVAETLTSFSCVVVFPVVGVFILW